MTTIHGIEKDVVSLPQAKYRQFREWFFEYDWEEWTKQIQTDSNFGKMDFLIQEAMNEKKQCLLRNL
ncbi:MAG: hypothetical protein V1833_06590 [Elusimicrobiota bacterium]